MILYNLENSISDIRPFCRPLFSHSGVVKYTSSLLTFYKMLLKSHPLNLTGWIRTWASGALFQK